MDTYKAALRKNRLRVRNFRKKQKIEKNHTKDCNLTEDNSVIVTSTENDTSNKQENCNILPLEIEDSDLQPSAVHLQSTNVDSSRFYSANSEIIQSEEECVDEALNKFDRFSSDDDSDFSDADIDDDSVCETEENLNVSCESNLAMDLRKWSKECIIPYSHFDALLKILRPYHPELPLTSKTLLKRSGASKYEITKFNPHDIKDNSQYVYFGLAEQLQTIVNPALHDDNILKLQFHVDGLLLFSSSNVEFWPILGRVYTKNNFYEPFEIAVHCGNGKPKSVQLFLKKFTEELNTLLKWYSNKRQGPS